VKYQRALGEANAKRCEEATTPKCRCRCGGMAHGINRTAKPSGVGGVESLWELPVTDPHHPQFKGIDDPAQDDLFDKRRPVDA
jgi:hypothetical protein